MGICSFHEPYYLMIHPVLITGCQVWMASKFYNQGRSMGKFFLFKSRNIINQLIYFILNAISEIGGIELYLNEPIINS